jgi:hypothetical protein
VATCATTEAARRAGVSLAELRRLVELGIVSPGEDGRFTGGAVRRVGLVSSLVAAGVPLEGLGTAIRGGTFSLDFLDAPAFEPFSALGDVTFGRSSRASPAP